MKPPSTSPTSVRGLPPPQILALIFLLLGLVAAFCRVLWPEWRHNPDLSHGFFAPVVFALLLWESRRHGTQRWLPSGRRLGVVVAGIVGLGFAAFVLAGLLAASVSWSHAVVSFLLAASLCCFLTAGLMILADERLRVMPFNWVSFTAIFLWMLVAPLPYGTYTRVMLSLQTGVTGGVLHALQLLGIPARQHGNVIELATTTVGVEEACSGIRSLLSCVYAGFFFAAWQLRRPARRLLLIVVAPLLAIGMNFVRSLILTLLANDGRNIAGFWHDATSLAILGVTALLLGGFAIVLETKREPVVPDPMPAYPRVPRWSLGIFWLAAAATLGLGGFYYSYSRPISLEGKPIPDLATMVPPAPAGWEVVAPRDLRQFAGVLQTTHLMERTYLRATSDHQLVQLTVYISYWPAGQTTVSRVASHTPDACWPGSGWNSRPITDARNIPQLAEFKIPPAEYRLFENAEGYPQHVWFWHIYDGHPLSFRAPSSVPALLRLSLEYGFRRQSDQYFIRISCNRPWYEIAHEPLVAAIFKDLAKTGL